MYRRACLLVPGDKIVLGHARLSIHEIKYSEEPTEKIGPGEIVRFNPMIEFIVEEKNNSAREMRGIIDYYSVTLHCDDLVETVVTFKPHKIV